MPPNTDTPLCSAICSSARQLYLLLRCISFSSKTQVRVSADGLRFSAEETSVMEAFVFLSKTLFSTYNFQDPEVTQHDLPEHAPPPPTFQLSLPALLETLQIFTLGDTASFKQQQDPYDGFAAHRLNRHAQMPFSSAALGHSGFCRISYQNRGSPLSINLSESSVSTTCDLTTYEASSTEDIPFDRDSLSLKTIMKASHLADAINELASANPTTLSLRASPASPYLSLSASGPLGSATVEFDKDPQLLETFQCATLFTANYCFAHLKAAYRAMTSASKVSVRTDVQSVLSLQFLVEVEPNLQTEGREGVAFVDFRIVPLIEGEGDGHDDDDDDDDDDDASTEREDED
ncbi:hypothetical protein AAFC00_002691 [Neodothiora populina]|uniref:DNA repair exonuclease rad1 n=1 Tax=Neodothiora populina TaxID=2781224 RepID=A0ABR3P875_9PEZI